METKESKFKTFIHKTLKNDGFQTVITSLWCALIGLFAGLIILIFINPYQAGNGMLATLENYFVFSNPNSVLKFAGQTLAKTAPLLVISLSVVFSYKAGLFNIGASGQYVAAVIIVTYAGVAWRLNWILVIILAMIAGAIMSLITGLLKIYFNVSEVISGIMVNWIIFYLANWVISENPVVWDASTSKAFKITQTNPAFIPNIGLDKIFGGNTTIGLGVIIALVAAAIVMVVLSFTTFGYQVKAIGLNKDAARYAGMKEKRNIIIVTLISGALAGLAASLYLQNGYMSWSLSSTVPNIGFDGISAAFLGGLNPIGAIFSSYFITHIIDGGSMITDLGFPPQVANIMTSLIIYLSGFVSFAKSRINKNTIDVNDGVKRNKKVKGDDK